MSRMCSRLESFEPSFTNRMHEGTAALPRNAPRRSSRFFMFSSSLYTGTITVIS